MNEVKHIKIAFKLHQGEDRYPPVEWEDLWALPVGAGKFCIDNVPFYVKLISLGDVIAASNIEERWVFQKLLVPGGHSTLRIIMYDDELVSQVREELADYGCSTELSHIPSFFSVDVPPHADYKAVVELLDQHAGQGVLDYEEASIQHADGCTSQ